MKEKELKPDHKEQVKRMFNDYGKHVERGEDKKAAKLLTEIQSDIRALKQK